MLAKNEIYNTNYKTNFISVSNFPFPEKYLKNDKGSTLAQEIAGPEAGAQEVTPLTTGRRRSRSSRKGAEGKSLTTTLYPV